MFFNDQPLAWWWWRRRWRRRWWWGDGGGAAADDDDVDDDDDDHMMAMMMMTMMMMIISNKKIIMMVIISKNKIILMVNKKRVVVVMVVVTVTSLAPNIVRRSWESSISMSSVALNRGRGQQWVRQDYFWGYYFNKMDPKQTLHFKVTADNLVKQNLRDGRTTASRTYGAKLLVAWSS